MSSMYVQLDHHHDEELPMINRHSPFYIKAVQQGKAFKSSNRNQVLLGEEDHVRNTGLDEIRDFRQTGTRVS